MVNNTFITLKARKNPVFSKYFKKNYYCNFVLDHF